MKLVIMLILYAAQFTLGGFLTDLCLRRWKTGSHSRETQNKVLIYFKDALSRCRNKGAALMRRLPCDGLRQSMSTPIQGVLTRCASLRKRVPSRLYWLAPYILLALFPLAGAFLPDSRFKFSLQAIGNIWLGVYLLFVDLLAVGLGAVRLRKVCARRPVRTNPYGKLLCMALVSSLLLGSYGMVHARRPVTDSYILTVHKNAEQNRALTTYRFKIVLIADLHLGVNSSLSAMKQTVELINRQYPDVVLVGGDVFNSSCKALSHPDEYAETLRGIRSRYGVYAVYGNHDVDETLLGGFAVSPVSEAFRSKETEEFFAKCGFITLEDRFVTLPCGVQIAGRVDGEKAGDGTSDRLPPDRLLAGVDRSLPVVVLEHEPFELKELARSGADLILCGHTHAGQIFPGNLIVPFFNENAYGYERLYGADTVVTAGVGYYGPPIRLGTDSEVTVVELNFQ